MLVTVDRLELARSLKKPFKGMIPCAKCGEDVPVPNRGFLKTKKTT